MDERFLTPIDASEIKIVVDQTNLIANPTRDQRGLRIVEDDAFLLIEPAWSFVDFGDDCVEAEVSDAIPEYAIRGVKSLSLPCEEVYEVRDFIAELCTVSYNCGAPGLSIRDVADGAVAEEFVELNVGQVEKFLNGVSHTVALLFTVQTWEREDVAAALDLEKKSEQEGRILDIDLRDLS
jgi:hypothetical protein